MWDLIREEISGGFTAVPPALATIRLGVALILGGVIGFERERAEKSAGLRTHMLISTAACLFILVAHELTQQPLQGQGEMRVDPLRLIEAVTAGVAFLAAGVIFTSGDKVKNLTTGASMWLAGAVGLACGAGQAPLAAIATLITVMVLWLVNKLER